MGQSISQHSKMKERDMEEYDYKEIPRHGGNNVYAMGQRLEREGWELYEYRGSRIIFRKLKKSDNGNQD